MRPAGRASARLVLLSVVLSLLSPWSIAIARANEQPRAKLTYVWDNGIDHCPDERELKDAVASRLGYDPFVDAAEREVAIQIKKTGKTAVTGVLDVRGPRPGHREIGSPGGDCKEVVDALAVAAAIAIDPASLTRPPAPPPPPPPPPDPIAPPAPPDRPPLPPRDPISGRLAVAPEAVLGELPAIGFGILASGGIRYRWLGVSLEGEATLPAKHLDARGTVNASLLTVAAVPCGHFAIAFGCLVGRIGALRGEGEGVGRPLRATEPYGAVGARIGVEVPLAASVSLRAHVDLVVPVTLISLRLDGVETWAVPSWAGRAAIGVGMRF